MPHLLILADFLCLAAGLSCLIRIASLHRAERSPRSRARLGFFAAYSYVMVAAALFAYAAVNIGVGAEGNLVLVSLIFAGMAALELTMPRMVFADAGAELPLLAKRLVAAGAALAAAQAGVIWTLPGPPGNLVPFICAFGPFGATVAWTTLAGARLARARGAGRGSSRDKLFGAAYILILAGSALEIRLSVVGPAQRPFLSLSLPLAYLVSSLQFLFALSAGAAPATLALPEELARRLSPRELEVALCILEGLGNKEIAARLGISENTARNHIYSLYQKLGIQKRMDLLGLLRGGADSTKVPGPPGSA